MAYDGEIAAEFINTLAINGLNQYNSIHNTNTRILDLILSNFPIASTHPIQPLTKCDSHHPPFVIEYKTNDLKFIKANKANKLNFFRANYDSINYELSQLDWDSKHSTTFLSVNVVN